MKNFWKWILGIVIVLVVLFGLGIGARLLMANLLPARVIDLEGFRHPMMTGRGFYNFGGGFMMLGGLIPLGLIALLAYGAYRLGKRAPMPPAPPPPFPAASCPKCGQPVQPGWNHCASCGEKL